MKTRRNFIVAALAIFVICLASVRFQQITVFHHDGTSEEVRRLRLPFQDGTHYPEIVFAEYRGKEYVCFGLIKSKDLFRRPILFSREAVEESANQ